MSTPRRKQHLLNGRRVQVLDLMNAGLVDVDEVLTYRRPQAAQEHIAVVDRRGHLRVDDQVFKTLSGAASALSATQIDGWEAWSVVSSGKPLWSLRHELLAENARQDVSSSTPAMEDTTRAKRHDYLLTAAHRAANGSAVEVTLRELLTHWNAQTRNSDVDEEIEADLANYGLSADPSMSTLGPGDTITLRPTSEIHKTLAESSADPRGSEPGHPVDRLLSRTDSRTTVRRISVGSLPSALGGVESVNPQSSIEVAITKMAVNDYSQLAVMSGERNPSGAVSWKSIARARNIDPNCSLRAAIFTPNIFESSDDLIQALPVLDDDDFFLVRGPKMEISGIVTASDVVRAYKQLASPFLMIGEIDQMLRRIVEVTYDSETIVASCDPDGTREISSVTQLTIGDYAKIIENADRWTDLEWRLDRRTFCQRLDDVRRVRNTVMHFNGDPIPDVTLRMLKNFIALLREYGTA